MQYIKGVVGEPQLLTFSNPLGEWGKIVFTSYASSFEVDVIEGWWNSLFTTVEFSLTAAQAALVEPGITWKVSFAGASDYCQSSVPASQVIEYQSEG